MPSSPSRRTTSSTHSCLVSCVVSKIVVIGIFLAAFAIPVTFNSIMWVFGSGSLASVASFTPGSVGVTQATNALALDACCDVPKATAVDYSTAQQLITTGWNQVVALILVITIFGWTGGKHLVTTSYKDAKDQAADMKAQRAEKRAESGPSVPSREGGCSSRDQHDGDDDGSTRWRRVAPRASAAHAPTRPLVAGAPDAGGALPVARGRPWLDRSMLSDTPRNVPYEPRRRRHDVRPFESTAP